MRYQPFPFDSFGGGLNLTAKADAVEPNECIDALNVLFTERGAIEQRDGYDNFTSALTNRVESLEPYYTTGGTKQLLAGCGTRLEALSTSGTVTASATGLESAVWDFARFGQPNSEVAYAGNGKNTLRKWNGSEWTGPTATVNGEASKAMPKAGALCVQSWDNRLVASGFATTSGGPNGTTSSPSHVYWSESGNPESWNTTDVEQFTPGDGEKIQAVIAWRESVFVFKETKFFVLYGTSTDAEGGAVFNFRPVEAGVGLASPRAVCAHHTGVYFMSRRGVYRTTGQEPELMSTLIDPIWAGGASPFYTGGILSHASITNCAMWTKGENIYLAFPTSEANNRTLVYDPRFEWWSLTSIPASCGAAFRAGNTEEVFFGYASGEKEVGRHGSSYTNDDGSAITSYWRSGWFDLGSADVKKIRASKVWGTGKFFMGMAHDFQESVGTLTFMDCEASEADTWGGTTWGGGEWAGQQSLTPAERRRAARGTTFSMYFENRTKDQDWSVHRVEHLAPSVREPGILTA